MLFQNYRELVTEKAAKEYFDILPEKKRSKSKNKKSEEKLAAKSSPKNHSVGGPAKRAKSDKAP
jgi:hypothetical protein